MKLLAVLPSGVSLPSCSEEEWLELKRRTDEEWTRVSLPPGWEEVRVGGTLDGMRAAKHGRSTVMFSAGQHDGKWWLHVSIAHPEKMPSYLDLVDLKRIFVGRDRQAIQVFPRESEHVNIYGRALHLWCCLDDDGLPRFGAEGTI